MSASDYSIRLVAQLGGFLGRKSDGEQGGKSLWLG
ncbi:IS4 family transposase, partial [Stenotrophomonas sp. NPDC077659]